MKLASIALLIIGLLTAPLQALTLTQCYHMAVSQNESVQIALEKISQSDALIEQGWSTVLPKLHLMGSEFFQDTGSISSTSGTSSLTPAQRSEYKLNVYQPLFQGFKEWTGLDALKSQKLAQEYRLRRARVGLFQELAQSFYGTMLRERDLKNLDEIQKISAKRIDELKRRVELGKSRTSELSSAQAQLAGVLAEKERLTGEIALYRQNLSYLTASDFSQTPLSEAELPAARLLTPDEINASIENRSDIRALTQDWEYQKKISQVDHQAQMPVVSVQGNYYLKRSGYQSPIAWDVLLALDWPLYQGGSDTGLIKQQESIEKTAYLTLLQAKRQVFSVFKSNFYAYSASLAQARELEKAHGFAKRSYELLENEYRLGLANNLEVLQALNTLLDTRRNLDRTQMQSQLYAWQLKIDREEAP